MSPAALPLACKFTAHKKHCYICSLLLKEYCKLYNSQKFDLSAVYSEKNYKISLVQISTNRMQDECLNKFTGAIASNITVNQYVCKVHVHFLNILVL